MLVFLDVLDLGMTFDHEYSNVSFSFKNKSDAWRRGQSWSTLLGVQWSYFAWIWDGWPGTEKNEDLMFSLDVLVHVSPKNTKFKHFLGVETKLNFERCFFSENLFLISIDHQFFLFSFAEARSPLRSPKAALQEKFRKVTALTEARPCNGRLGVNEGTVEAFELFFVCL